MMAVMSYFQLRKELHECVPELSLSIVGKEQAIFSRLLYRAKNQHRREKCFQKLVRASKDIKKYLLLAPDEQVQSIVKLLSRKPAANDNQHVSKLAWDFLNCATFTAATLKHLEDTFGEVHQQLLRRLFVPVNVLFVASLSRFWYCLRYHLNRIIKTYDILRPYVIGNTGEQLPQVHVHLPQSYHCYFDGARELTALPAPLLADVPSADVPTATVPKGPDVPASSQVPPILTSVVDFGVPVKPTVEQLICRQKDFSSTGISKAISFRDDHNHMTRDDHNHVTRDDHNHVTRGDHNHVTRDDHNHLTRDDHNHLTRDDHNHMTRDDHNHMTRDDHNHVTRDDHNHVTRGDHDGVGKSHSFALLKKGMTNRRNGRLIKVLARMRRPCGAAGAACIARIVTCRRRTPYGVRATGLSSLKCARHLNLAHKNK